MSPILCDITPAIPVGLASQATITGNSGSKGVKTFSLEMIAFNFEKAASHLEDQ